ncbi:hypothetical protein [Methylobacterium sp. 37f]|uniref:hypothetical protein n=1 Tax=Methylobacterium sp. 37f TaxID=2817058 RepID=UPI001FFC6136|nr:hypothetical protein [Methylobacterium sp. 37f]MCK2056636.1 hypothetical protein [Methylobacterium sp. 37f]
MEISKYLKVYTVFHNEIKGNTRDKSHLTYAGGISPNEKDTGRNNFSANIEASGHKLVGLDIVSTEKKPDPISPIQSYSETNIDINFSSMVEIITHGIENAVGIAVSVCESRQAEERAKFVAEAAKLNEEIASLREQLEMFAQTSG